MYLSGWQIKTHSTLSFIKEISLSHEAYFLKKSIPFSFTQKVAKKEYKKKIELLAVGYSEIIKHCYFLKIHNLYPDKTHNVVSIYSESVLYISSSSLALE